MPSTSTTKPPSRSVPPPAPPRPSHTLNLAARLADELAERWRKGERPGAEEYLKRHPDLLLQPDAAIHLIYEEICQRQEAGEARAADLVIARYPQWQEQLRLLLECHQLLTPEEATPRFPEVGEWLIEYQLIAELGRGAQGRVYLARQPALNERLVVLKVIPFQAQEHLSLARLQHTHIVPLYAAHIDLERNVRVLCMPYFGGVTLDRLLTALKEIHVVRRKGQDLIDILDRVHPAPLYFTKGAAREYFARATYVQAVCKMGVWLAEALHYAHERGLVHLDVKPANVLLASDGGPMLLDFHLARAPVWSSSTAAGWLGGTLQYMSPEQEQALAAVREARRVPATVGVASDIYSLGLVLFEALGGAMPPHPDNVPLHKANPDVSVGLTDVLQRCLHRDPAARYQTAADLARDLTNHLDDRPLVGVGNRNWFERWRKWRRRQPLGLALWAMGVLVVVAAVGGMYYFWRNARQQELLALLHARQLAGQRLDAATELKLAAERLRFVYGAEELTPKELRDLEANCRALWTGQQDFGEGQQPLLDPAAEQRLQEDLLDLTLIELDVRFRLARPGNAGPTRLKILYALDKAEERFGRDPVIDRERERHARSLGAPVPNRGLAEPATAYQYTALGRWYYRQGRYDRALAELHKAVALQPDGFWAYYYQGLSNLCLRRHAEASVAFGICVALKPQRAECYYNRGRANAGLQKNDEALHDLTQALRLDPHLDEAYFQRGQLYFRTGHYADALEDFHHALVNSGSEAEVHCHLALVHEALKNPAEARRHVGEALRFRPQHPLALELAERLHYRP